MKPKKLPWLIPIIFACLLLPTFLNAEIYEKKADNFIVLFDTSSSMVKNVQDSETSKLYAARNALQQISADIPALNYTSGIYTFTPFKEVKALSPHDKNEFNAAIESLPESLKFNGIFSGGTPLGYGLKKLGRTLESLSGKTVVYLFSDGTNTDALDPVREAATLNEKFDVCFSIISLADNAGGSRTLESIATINDCSHLVQLESLDQDISIASNELFLAIADPEPSSEEVQEAEAYSPPDSDNDGINDDLDKCENTPIGYNVDPNGCLISEPLISQNTYFGSGTAAISSASISDLSKLGNYLAAHPEATTIISGYTDNRGNAQFNMQLSQKRAENIRDFLASNFDVNEDNIKIRWFGESNPIASNETEEGRSKNRCVQIQIEGAYKLK